MLTWEDRIDIIKETCGIKNNRQLEDELGLANGYINDLIRGKNKNPSKITTALVTIFNINPVWFYDDNVGMFGDKHGDYSTRESELIVTLRKVETNYENRLSGIEKRLSRLEEKLDNSNSAISPADNADGLSNNYYYSMDRAPEYAVFTKVPYVNDIAAGLPIAQSEDQSDFIEVPSRHIKNGNKYYAARIVGTSMIEAGIRDGDLVLIRQAGVPQDRAIMVIRSDGESTLKRLREVEGKGWELHYEDGSGRIIPPGKADYEVQGEFVAVVPESSSETPEKKAPERTRSR